MLSSILYKANLQNILFNRFEKLKVYEFIRYHKIENHAISEILCMFDEDVAVGKIKLVTDGCLKAIGMYNIFQRHAKDIKILF